MCHNSRSRIEAADAIPPTDSSIMINQQSPSFTHDMTASRSLSRCSLLEKWPATLAIYLLALLALGGRGPAAAQEPPPPPAPSTAPSAAAPPAVQVPGFWDPRRRPDRPDLSRLSVIRFLTETDFPPFNFAGPDGNPAGFNVDLARLVCEEIKVTCTIQMRRFETLLDAISSNRGDAIIASLAVT